MENYKAIKEDTRKMENCKANNVPKKRFSQKLPGVFQGRWVFSETGRVDKDFIYSIWKKSPAGKKYGFLSPGNS